MISDGASEVEVEYTGILPDLFAEDQGIVGTGKLDESGRFVAKELLAKHDKNYTPVEGRARSDRGRKCRWGISWFLSWVYWL